jgi:hypothetical protein
MAVKLIFNGSKISKTEDHELKLYANNKNEIFVDIDIPEFSNSFIVLDKETAIKLSKELRKQIAIISENEIYNG